VEARIAGDEVGRGPASDGQRGSGVGEGGEQFGDRRVAAQEPVAECLDPRHRRR
jgi:hypothetical protein